MLAEEAACCCRRCCELCMAKALVALGLSTSAAGKVCIPAPSAGAGPSASCRMNQEDLCTDSRCNVYNICLHLCFSSAVNFVQSSSHLCHQPWAYGPLRCPSAFFCIVVSHNELVHFSLVRCALKMKPRSATSLLAAPFSEVLQHADTRRCSFARSAQNNQGPSASLCIKR